MDILIVPAFCDSIVEFSDGLPEAQELGFFTNRYIL